MNQLVGIGLIGLAAISSSRSKRFCLFLPVEKDACGSFRVGFPIRSVMGSDPAKKGDHMWCSDSPESLVDAFLSGAPFRRVGAAVDFSSKVKFRQSCWAGKPGVYRGNFKVDSSSVGLSDRRRRTRLVIGEPLA